MSRFSLAVILAVVGVDVGVGQIAHADGPASAIGDATTPWAVGVSPQHQAEANALFAEANQLFAQQAHAPALEKYRAAIALWDHPLIEFNMAVTLIRLDRVLEASAALESALRFGDKPFTTTELYQQALDYKSLLAGRVGNVVASCTQSNAQIVLDGKPWFACPGSRTQRVLAGEHVIVGELSGYMTSSRRVVVNGGADAKQDIALVPISVGMTPHYPQPRWLPYATIGVGVAAGLGGVAFYFAGRNQMSQFTADFQSDCPSGCETDLSKHSALAAERDSAELKGDIGVSMMVTGGVLAVGGVVWAIVNTKRSYMAPIEVAPMPGGMAASVHVKF